MENKLRETKFWETKSLQELNPQEWEALCDGCAKCCLQKLEDEDSGEVFYTDLACRLLDSHSGRCKNYPERFKQVPDCMKVSLEDLEEFHWLPYSCAYRTLAEGRKLQSWHPLLSGNPESIHEAGISVRGKVISEDSVPMEDWEEHIVHWVDF